MKHAESLHLNNCLQWIGQLSAVQMALIVFHCGILFAINTGVNVSTCKSKQVESYTSNGFAIFEGYGWGTTGLIVDDRKQASDLYISGLS